MTYVHAGQVVVSAEAEALTTILGSCVSVCLYDAVARVGGLNHYLLPCSAVAPLNAARYGPGAIALLFDQMIASGATATRMAAQIFGGAAVLAAFGNEKDHLGMRNARLARAILLDYGVAITVEDVGGTRGRVLTFSPRDGVARVQLIRA